MPPGQYEGAGYSCRSAPEKGICGQPVRLGFLPVGAHAEDFRLQQGNARVEFVSRIRIENFLSEQSGGVGSRPGAVFIVHCTATSKTRRLLSTVRKGRSGDSFRDKLGACKWLKLRRKT